MERKLIDSFELYPDVFIGLGPGGLDIINKDAPFKLQCIPGSSHGGTGYRDGRIFKARLPYNKHDIASLLGGSGGETVFVIIFYNPARIFPWHSFATRQMPFRLHPTRR